MANIACYDLQGQPLKHFYQWDSKRSIVITGKNFAECTVCDFGIDDKDKTITVKPQILDDRLVVEVPDFLLTNTKAIKLYVCEDNDNGSYKTLFLVTIPIKERPKPEDYEGDCDGFEHYHSNKSILDKLSILDGKLYFDGEILGSQTNLSPEKLELIDRLGINSNGDLTFDEKNVKVVIICEINKDGELIVTANDTEYNLGRIIGLSAYEIAVKNGFKGSEEDWISSISLDKETYENIKLNTKHRHKHNNLEILDMISGHQGETQLYIGNNGDGGFPLTVCEVGQELPDFGAEAYKYCPMFYMLTADTLTHKAGLYLLDLLGSDSAIEWNLVAELGSTSKGADLSTLTEQQKQAIVAARVYQADGELYIDYDDEQLDFSPSINENGELVIDNDSSLIDFEIRDGDLFLLYTIAGDMLKETYDPRDISRDVYEYADEVGAAVRKEITSKAEKTEVVPRFNNGFGMGYTKHRRLHVKGTSGSDDNDGITESTAIKTLDKFFSLLNEGYNDLRCYIEEPGVYDINRWVVLDCAIHITATVPGVTINFTSDRFATPWYNTHPNFQGISDSAPLTITSANEKWYLENSQTAFKYCKFNTLVENYGGGGIFENCTFQQINFKNGSVAYLAVPTFIGSGPFVVVDTGSRVTLAKGMTMNNSPSNGNACISVSGGSEFFPLFKYPDNRSRSLMLRESVMTGKAEDISTWIAKSVEITDPVYNVMGAFEDLSKLGTTDKTSLINAINELNERVNSLENN